MTVDEFIAKWEPSGGHERANTQLFVTDLCALLGVDAVLNALAGMGRVRKLDGGRYVA